VYKCKAFHVISVICEDGNNKYVVPYHKKVINYDISIISVLNHFGFYIKINLTQYTLFHECMYYL